MPLAIQNAPPTALSPRQVNDTVAALKWRGKLRFDAARAPYLFLLTPPPGEDLRRGSHKFTHKAAEHRSHLRIRSTKPPTRSAMRAHAHPGLLGEQSLLRARTQNFVRRGLALHENFQACCCNSEPFVILFLAERLVGSMAEKDVGRQINCLSLRLQYFIIQ